MKNKNTKQDVEIARLQEWKKSFEKRFDNFIKNDFHALREDVRGISSKLFYGFILLIAVTLLTQVILKLFQ